MNPRVKELYEQAQDWADNQNFFASEYYDYMMEKFAEMIVRECADIASDVGTDTVPSDFALDKCYEIESKIKERFGVK